MHHPSRLSCVLVLALPALVGCGDREVAFTEVRVSARYGVCVALPADRELHGRYADGRWDKSQVDYGDDAVDITVGPEVAEPSMGAAWQPGKAGEGTIWFEKNLDFVHEDRRILDLQHVREGGQRLIVMVGGLEAAFRGRNGAAAWQFFDCPDPP